MAAKTQTLSDKANLFLNKGRTDLAAVFFAAAAQDPNASELEQFAASQNASLCGEKAAEGIWGTTATEFFCDPRHEDVCAAVSRASADGKRVLLLGSAAGAYILAAKEGGASCVVSHEANALLEYVVGQVVQCNDLSEFAEVTTEPLTSLGHEPFDVIVAVERCWGSALSSNSLAEMSSVRKLLKEGGCMIPESISIWTVAHESRTLHTSNWIDVSVFQEETDLDYTAYNSAARRSRMAYRLPPAKYGRTLSKEAEWVIWDAASFLKGSAGALNSKVLLTIEAAGQLSGITTCSSLKLNSLTAIDWRVASSDASSWRYCHYLSHIQLVKAGEHLSVHLELAKDGMRLSGKKLCGDSIELSPYHTCMLSIGAQRTSAYRKGITETVRALKDKHGQVTVLDVGCGSGLLSFFAAQAGADVIACERSGTVAALAKVLAESNESSLSSGSVKILHSKSGELFKAGSELPMPHLVISEIFGTDPLSETILPVMKDLSEQFAKAEPPVSFLPCRCRLWGAVAKVPQEWACRTESASSCGIDIGEHMMPFESGRILVDLRDEFSDVEVVTAPEVLATHSLVPPIKVSGSCSVTLPLLSVAQPLHKLLRLPPPPEDRDRQSIPEELCLVMWFDADCTAEPSDNEDTRVSTSPAVMLEGGHWTQFVQILKSDDMEDGVLEAVAAGDGALHIKTTWQVDRTSFWIEVCEKVAGQAGYNE